MNAPSQSSLFDRYGLPAKHDPPSNEPAGKAVEQLRG